MNSVGEILDKFRIDRSIREAAAVENLKKYSDFNQVFVNDKAYPDLEFQYYEHPNAGEPGVLVYIPGHDFRQGKNIQLHRKDTKKES